ncbi:uncharacterized protein LOC141852917 [Brevipalpus obovatus]|uniref:uncharacterized protein LOC141852917 n=1 Tax=Brevipalpus obovatus TaxID=246614 RepID=UPI003D9F46D5
MFEWIQNAIKGVKFNRKGAAGKKEKKQDKNRKDKKSSLTPSTTDELRFSSAPETSILHCETRNRPRGPTGRRPPVRKNFNPSTNNRLSSTEMDSSDDHGLPNSAANGKISKETDSKILLDQSTLFNNDSSSPISSQPTTPNQQINDFPKASFVSNHKLQCNRKSGARLPQPQDAANTINTSSIHCDVNDSSNNSNVSPDHNGYPPPSFHKAPNSRLIKSGDAISLASDSLWSSERERLSSLFSWVHTVPGADVCKNSAQMKKDLKKVDDSLNKLSQQLIKLKASMTKTSTGTDSGGGGGGGEPGYNVQNDQNNHHHILWLDDICQQANDIRTFPLKHLSDSLDLVDDNFKLIIDSISEYISSKPPSPELVT